MHSSYHIIFGATVRPDGSPSGTLARRVQGAWQLSLKNGNSKFIATGAQGRYGPPEAQVMKTLLLELGAREEQIILEQESTDTLQSVINCKEILDQQGDRVSEIIICSSPYHNYRPQLLFRMLGTKSRRGRIPSDRPALGLWKWLYYYLREAAAIPWDCIHLSFLIFRRSV